MTTAEKDALNREICEKLRICWHEPKSGYDRLIKNDKMECVKCGGWFKVHPLDLRFIDNPDYIAHPTLVLKEMMKREDWPEFLETIGGQVTIANKLTAWVFSVYILDTTGKPRDLAIKFIRRGAKDERI